MAILRGGTRIFGQDIRIGLPRDNTLTRGGILKRASELPGKSIGASENTIGRFVAGIGQGEGFARQTRFLVRFNMPNKLKLNQQQYHPAEGFDTSQQGINDVGGQELARNVGMMCNQIDMPSRDINTKDHITYGPKRQMPYAYSFSGKVNLSVFGDKFLRQRIFFETWQKMIFDRNSHDMHYYDEYTGSVDIFQLGSFDAENDRDRVTYAVRLNECYPETIGSYGYNYGSQNEIVNLPITLNFRDWRNLGIDQVNNFSVGASFGTLPEIKPAAGFGGLFGGILNRLPPELKRAGQQVINTARRNLPIGRATGGRVFPPFL
jgi:hypothetical protein|tara:strand:+ start:1858 stop:2817 length:960 start_codon:yes stop_codon:yes gene_type:complete